MVWTLPVFRSSPILPGVLLTLISLWLLLLSLSSCQCRTAVCVRLRLVTLDRLFFAERFPCIESRNRARRDPCGAPRVPRIEKGGRGRVGVVRHSTTVGGGQAEPLGALWLW